MSISLPFPNNKRIEINIQPWAIKAQDASEMTEEFIGLWHTELSPMYAHPNLVYLIGGKAIAGIPDILIKFMIYDVSKYVSGIVTPSCTNPNPEFFCAIRQRYTALKALMNLLGGEIGPSQVIRKVLGDFEIEYSDKDGDGSLMSRVLNELSALDPVLRSGGCIGIGAGHGAVGVTKGAWDPYKPLFQRTHFVPDRGQSGVMNSVESPGFNSSSSRYDNRWSKSNRPGPYNRRRGGY